MNNCYSIFHVALALCGGIAIGGVVGALGAVAGRLDSPECPPPDMCLVEPCDEAACADIVEREGQYLHSAAINEALDTADRAWSLTAQYSRALARCQQQQRGD